MENVLIKSKQHIIKFFKNYSFKDICDSLLIISLWLPNISSTVKPSFLFLCLFEILDCEFPQENKLKEYSDFKIFFSKIKTFTPDFIGIEDYIPEDDWGDVFYYIDNNFYKYLYGGELENTYDHLKYFEFFHCAIAQELHNTTQQNPKEDLKKILKLQNSIIESITTNKTNDGIRLGDFVLPGEDFWIECKLFLDSKLNLKHLFNEQTLDWYSQTVPASKEILTDKNFGEAFLTGNAINSLFVKKDNEYYLLPPRRMVAVLLDKWNKVINNHIKIIEAKENNLVLKKKLSEFIHSKISLNSYYFDNISLIKESPKDTCPAPDILLVYENRLLVILLQELCEDAVKDTVKHLTQLNKKIPLIKNLLLNENNLKFINNNQLVELRQNTNQANFTPEIDFIVVHPSLTTSFNCLGFREKLNFKLFNYTDFIQFVDEFKNMDDLFKKIDFIKKGNRKSLSSLADLISFYSSENEGNILTGCNDYNHTFLDPFYSDKTRYENLKNFWKLSPKETVYDISPENWIFEKMENSNSVYMYSLHYNTIVVYCQINDTSLFIHTLFPEYDTTNMDGIKIFSEMVEDAFTRHSNIVKNHLFFKSNKKFKILVVPMEIVLQKNIKELMHLINNEEIWLLDKVRFSTGANGIRIVFDKEKLFNNLIKATDRELQTNLFIDIINRINEMLIDTQATKKIIEQAINDKDGEARFMTFAVKKETCFPVRHENIYPEKKDFIKTQNIMAKILHKANITPGNYDLDKAKYILDKLKSKLIEYINDEIKKYNFKSAIPKIITYNDAIINTYAMKEKRIKASTQHEVDYSREGQLSESHEKFLRESANYRYLIEKFVQINPTGEKNLDNDSLSFLLAMIDWLIITFKHSDYIHYDLFACGLIVKEDKSIETIFKEDFSVKEEQYAKIEAVEELYKDYKNIEFTSYMKYHNDFCKAFKDDFGFNFQNMINILTIMSQWCEEEKTYIIANEKEIALKARKYLDKYSSDDEQELPLILDYLTLKQNDITKILDKNNFNNKFQCKDIPLDEFNLRYCRYTIKPLIQYENQFLWGPYSAQRSGMTFRTHLDGTRMPYNLQNSRSLQILEKIKKIHEQELVVNAYKILSKYTQFIDKEVYLHKRDKSGNHPLELGDYDVLAYLPNSNILLNVECKHHLGAYSAKDARKYLDKMYEPDKSGKNAIDKVINREQYLDQNYHVALDILGTKSTNKPQIISLYVTKIRTFYIMFPREKTNIKLLSIYDLDDYLKSILNIIKPNTENNIMNISDCINRDD